ncbi:hypothetical protein C7M84_021163, partial [Penaeus vannamei]
CTRSSTSPPPPLLPSPSHYPLLQPLPTLLPSTLPHPSPFPNPLPFTYPHQPPYPVPFPPLPTLHPLPSPTLYLPHPPTLHPSPTPYPAPSSSPTPCTLPLPPTLHPLPTPLPCTLPHPPTLHPSPPPLPTLPTPPTLYPSPPPYPALPLPPPPPPLAGAARKKEILGELQGAPARPTSRCLAQQLHSGRVIKKMKCSAPAADAFLMPRTSSGPLTARRSARDALRNRLVGFGANSPRDQLSRGEQTSLTLLCCPGSSALAGRRRRRRRAGSWTAFGRGQGRGVPGEAREARDRNGALCPRCAREPRHKSRVCVRGRNQYDTKVGVISAGLVELMAGPVGAYCTKNAGLCPNQTLPLVMDGARLPATLLSALSPRPPLPLLSPAPCHPPPRPPPSLPSRTPAPLPAIPRPRPRPRRAVFRAALKGFVRGSLGGRVCCLAALFSHRLDVVTGRPRAIMMDLSA